MPMRTNPVRKLKRCIRAELHEMLSRMSIVTLILCFITALLPTVLLSALLLWKAFFFPAALPKLLWGIFLPIWVLFSSVPPAFVCAVLLSFPAGQVRCVFRILLPACTLLLLLSCMFSLFLLYHTAYFLCVFCAALLTFVSLFCIPYAYRLSQITGGIMLISTVWNFTVFFIALHF